MLALCLPWRWSFVPPSQQPLHRNSWTWLSAYLSYLLHSDKEPFLACGSYQFMGSEWGKVGSCSSFSPAECSLGPRITISGEVLSPQNKDSLSHYKMLAAVSLVGSQNSNAGHWNALNALRNSVLRLPGPAYKINNFLWTSDVLKHIFMISSTDGNQLTRSCLAQVLGELYCINTEIRLFGKRVSTILEGMGTPEILDSGWEQSVFFVWLGNATC